MQYRTDIVPVGGMNTDDDPRYFEQGDYLEARNVRVGNAQDQGDQGLIKNFKSSLLISLPMINDDQLHEHLGVALDEENDRAYILSLVEESISGDDYFVIYKHDITANTYKIIFSALADDWNIQRWPSRAMLRYYNPRIVDGRLIWTDNDNDIRQMDVEKMEVTRDAGITTVVEAFDVDYAYEHGYSAGDFVFYLDRVYEVLQNTVGQDGYPPEFPTYYDDVAAVVDVYLDPIDPNNFTLAALPPLISLTAEYRPDPSINVNQLRGKTWQFTYQYVYMDYRRSTYAPPSLVPPPSQEEKTDGTPVTDPSQNNTIRLQINTGNEQVRSIRIVARTSEDPSTWFIVDEIFVVNDKDERVYAANQLLYVNFYNDKAGAVVPSATVYNMFHYVPIKAKHMELIEGNRLAFSNITEGYSRFGALVDINLAWEDLAGITVQTVFLTVTQRHQTVEGGLFPWLLELRIPTVDPGACTFKFRLKMNSADPYTYTTFVYDGLISYPSAVIAGIKALMDIDYPNESAPCFATGDYWFCYFPRTAQWPDNPYATWQYDFYYETTIQAIDKYPQLKTGATHAWAMIYRDVVGRITPLIGAGEMTKYIPFPTESTDSNVGRRPLVSFEINHLPPPQAASYEIVYAGNKSTSWHLQLMGYNFATGKKLHDDPAYPGSPSPENYRLRIQKCQLNTVDQLLNWSVETYSWEKGDRIRIIGKVSAAGVLTEINDAIYDVEILGVWDDTDYENDIGEGTSAVETINEWIYFPKNPDLPSFVPTSASQPNRWPDNLLVEIYRPFTTESNLYFTTGMTFEIGTDVYGHKYHKGDTNQVLNSQGQVTVPALVNNTSHDNWKYPRQFRDISDALTFNLWVESQYSTDFYITQIMTSQGNPIPDIDSQQQNVLTKRARHGGQVSIGSQLNYIAEFDYNDYVDLKDEHGPIEGMRLVGFVLKVIQYNKTTSIYISRQESFTASGDPQYLFTDKVFGSVRPEMDDYGTSHPGSVIVHNRQLYFWDQSEGVVIRDSANGQEPISRYKMKKFFDDLAKTMDGYSKANQRVEFGYNQDLNQLICAFGQASDTYKETIVFSETDNRWKVIYDLRLKYSIMYWIGKRLWHLREQYGFEWFKGTGYQNLGGSVLTGQVIFYATADAMKPQTFEAVIVYQKGDTPQFNRIDVPDKATSVEGAQLTHIYSENIKFREGVYYCQILRDENTPGPGSPADKQMNGRKLRGLYLKVDMLITETTDPVTLSNIIVLSTGSERSK